MCYAPTSSTTLDTEPLVSGTARLWFRRDQPGTETNRLFEHRPGAETNRLFESRPPQPGTAMRLWRDHLAPEKNRLFERSGVATR